MKYCGMLKFRKCQIQNTTLTKWECVFGSRVTSQHSINKTKISSRHIEILKHLYQMPFVGL